jgi:hypothetical protein
MDHLLIVDRTNLALGYARARIQPVAPATPDSG